MKVGNLDQVAWNLILSLNISSSGVARVVLSRVVTSQCATGIHYPSTLQRSTQDFGLGRWELWETIKADYHQGLAQSLPENLSIKISPIDHKKLSSLYKLEAMACKKEHNLFSWLSHLPDWNHYFCSNLGDTCHLPHFILVWVCAYRFCAKWELKTPKMWDRKMCMAL